MILINAFFSQILQIYKFQSSQHPSQHKKTAKCLNLCNFIILKLVTIFMKILVGIMFG